MLMADAFAITMIHVAALIILPGCWVLYGGLFPDALARGEERLRRMPFRIFFLGLGMAVVLGGSALLLGQAGIVPPAAILGVGLLLWGFFGVAPLARIVGSRLSPRSEAPWKSHALGGVTLIFPWMLFFAGWFFFLPLTIVIGLGAGTMACVRRSPAPAAPVPARQEEKVAIPV